MKDGGGCFLSFCVARAPWLSGKVVVHTSFGSLPVARRGLIRHAKAWMRSAALQSAAGAVAVARARPLTAVAFGLLVALPALWVVWLLLVWLFLFLLPFAVLGSGFAAAGLLVRKAAASPQAAARPQEQPPQAVGEHTRASESVRGAAQPPPVVNVQKPKLAATPMAPNRGDAPEGAHSTPFIYLLLKFNVCSPRK